MKNTKSYIFLSILVLVYDGLLLKINPVITNFYALLFCLYLWIGLFIFLCIYSYEKKGFRNIINEWVETVTGHDPERLSFVSLAHLYDVFSLYSCIQFANKEYKIGNTIVCLFSFLTLFFGICVSLLERLGSVLCLVFLGKFDLPLALFFITNILFFIIVIYIICIERSLVKILAYFFGDYALAWIGIYQALGNNKNESNLNTLFLYTSLHEKNITLRNLRKQKSAEILKKYAENSKKKD